MHGFHSQGWTGRKKIGPGTSGLDQPLIISGKQPKKKTYNFSLLGLLEINSLSLL